MQNVIEFFKWLDTSNLAYLLMILYFLIMVSKYESMYQHVLEENKKLKQLLKLTMNRKGE
jgi:hypothetical protein